MTASEDLDLGRRPPAATSEVVRLRFRLTDPHTGEPEDGLRDVRVLAFSTGNWNHRFPAAGVGDGVYEATLTLPEPGSYRILLECPSRFVKLHASPQLIVQAVSRQR